MAVLHVKRLVICGFLALALGCSAGMTNPNGGTGGNAPPPPDDASAGSGAGGSGFGGTGGGLGGSGGGAGGQTGGAGGGGGGSGGGGAAGGSGGGGGARDGGTSDSAAQDARATDGAGGQAGGAGGTGGGGPGGTGGTAPPGCTLKWSPSPMRDGIEVFEFLELPDRNMIHPAGTHLSVVAGERDAYRFDSHYEPPSPVDYDRQLFTGPMRTDRLRGEVRGMKGASGPLEMVNGQTWRIHWSLFIPATLKGTGRFTHIFQLKFVDTGGGLSGSPIITLSLSQPDNIALRLWLGGGTFPTVNLAPLHDRWLSSELVIKVAPGNTGSVKWTFKDGTRTLVDTMVSGNTWPGNARRVWPKWGIYRGITSGVRTTHMLTADFTAHQCQ